MTTIVCPMWSAPPENTSTAVWYSGEPTMWTLSSWGCSRKRKSIPPKPIDDASGVVPGSGRRTPLGFPVVPDV